MSGYHYQVRSNRVLYQLNIFRHTNILIPTWKEVRHFVWFLNIQLSACEQSNIIKRVPGLRTFVVDFMTTMSRVSVI